jgi:hypothetical protein
MGEGKVDAFNCLVSMKTEWRLKGCPEKKTIAQAAVRQILLLKNTYVLT